MLYLATARVSSIWQRAGAPILILSLGLAGYCAHVGSRVYIMEQSLCASYYESHAPSSGTLDSLVSAAFVKDRRGAYAKGKIPENMCKLPEIQAELVTLLGVVDALQSVPGLIVGVTWERLSLTLGRKTVLTLSSLGSALGVLYFMVICFFDNVFDLRWVTVMCLWDLIGGGWVSLQALLYTYVTERVEEKDLQKYFYNMSAWLLAMRGLGVLAASWLMRYEGGAWMASTVGLSLMMLSTLSCYFLPKPKSIPSNATTVEDTPIVNPVENSSTTQLMFAEEQGSYDAISSTSSSTEIGGDWTSGRRKLTSSSSSSLASSILSSIVNDVGQTLSVTYDVFVRDKFSRLCMGTYFCYCLFMGIRNIFPQYASKGFGWTLADADVLWGFEYVVSISTLVSIPYARADRTTDADGKEIVQMGGKDKDVFIMLFTATVSGVGLLMLGFAWGKTAYMVSLVIFTVGYSGLPDSLRTLAQREMKESSSTPSKISDAPRQPPPPITNQKHIQHGGARKELVEVDEDDDVSFLALDGGNGEQNNPALDMRENTPLMQPQIGCNPDQEEVLRTKEPTDKVSRFFIGFSLVENSGYFLSYPLWSWLYALTLRGGWRPAWMFIGCSIFCALLAVMVIFTERFIKEKTKGKSRDEDF